MPRPAVLLSALLLAFAALCSSASAQRVVVGSPLNKGFGYKFCTTPTGTWTNSSLGEAGAYVASPVDGAVVRWSMYGNYTSGKRFELRILRPGPGGVYTGAGTSAPETPSGGYVIYPTDLPIQAGDHIGMNVNDGCVSAETAPGSNFIDWFPALAEGATLAAPYGGTAADLGFNALVQPAPTVAAVGPTTSGPGGGGVVTIHGTDFEAASAVTFGGVPSPSFSVDLEGQITAVVPPGRLGSVPVTVTTIAGRATAPQQLTYQACVVPALTGGPPAAAYGEAGAASCAIGKVTHRALPKPKHKAKGKKKKKAKPTVVAQSRPPGTVLPVGAKIDLTVRG